MPVELIRFDDQPKGTPYPWSESERDGWYFVNWETPNGRGGDFYKRTAHAAAIGRAVLADRHAKGMQEVASVAVWQYETHADLEPYVVTTNEGAVDMVDLPRSNPLAIITDTTEPDDVVEGVEKAMEAAVIAQRAFNGARAKLLEACDIAHECDVSANSLARMVNGVISRPTLLKAIRVSEQRAAAEEA